jgi:hypothetical protein
MRPYLKKPFIKKGLVEWLKVKALNSSPSTVPKKNNNVIYTQINNKQNTDKKDH